MNAPKKNCKHAPPSGSSNCKLGSSYCKLSNPGDFFHIWAHEVYNTAPPTVNRAPPTVNTATPTVNWALSTVNVAPPTVNSAPPTVNVCMLRTMGRKYEKKSPGFDKVIVLVMKD